LSRHREGCGGKAGGCPLGVKPSKGSEHIEFKSEGGQGGTQPRVTGSLKGKSNQVIMTVNNKHEGKTTVRNFWRRDIRARRQMLKIKKRLTGGGKKT